MIKKDLKKLFLAQTLVWLPTTYVQALSLDGEGHYSLRGETRTAPGFSKRSGMHQAIDQFFRLESEARFNDRSSFFMEFGLFEDERAAYLGDSARPNEECPVETGSNTANNKGASATNPNCEKGPQFTGEPRYRAFSPFIKKAYARYAFDFCLMEAGRRARDWGLGIFLDSGEKPFDVDASIFDGITCDIGIEKDRTLGFSFGFDKIAETGAPTNDTDEVGYGPSDRSDDIDQYFFTIRYDDRKANAGSPITKQIGVYFANIMSGDAEDNGATDLKFLDLYTAFFVGDLTIRNEVLIRLGKSEDPYWYNYGGARDTKNKLDTAGIAGSLEWTLSRSGNYIGPKYLGEGDASRQVFFFEYARAPGDDSSYFTRDRSRNVDEARLANINELNRDSSAKALGFHRNYKPALLLFNGRSTDDNLIVPGAFDPGRVINTTLFSIGYRYESLENGNYEAKLITARMINEPSNEVKNYWQTVDDSGNEQAAKEERAAAGIRSWGPDGFSRPAGVYGSNIGTELDLKFWINYNQEVDLGLAAAYAIPGEAWRTNKDEGPKNSFLIQSYASFKF